MLSTNQFRIFTEISKIRRSYRDLYWDDADPLVGDRERGECRSAVELNNSDLCTLAYQLYHQSLCLPLDPWYDIMSRVGSDRRTNICRLTHEYATHLGKTGSQAGQGF